MLLSSLADKLGLFCVEQTLAVGFERNKSVDFLGEHCPIESVERTVTSWNRSNHDSKLHVPVL